MEAGSSIEFIEQKLQVLLGGHYHFGQTFSYLYSPEGKQTYHQAIHSDSVSGDSYNGLVVLTDDCDPTIFQKLKKLAKPISGPLTVSNSNGKVMNEEQYKQLESNFSSMLKPVAELENEMYPLSENNLKAGTLILFRSDMIHRGPPCSKNKFRGLLFFTFKRGPGISSDTQVHAALLGELLYGRNTVEQYELMKNHMNSPTPVSPSLSAHLSIDSQRLYENWLTEQSVQINV